MDDATVDFVSRYRDSEKYVLMENNYQYMKCRSQSHNKGGASGDRADRDHKNPDRVKHYQNYEKQWATRLR